MTETPAVLELLERARERVQRHRPDWRCPTPGCDGEMDVRRSGLHEGPVEDGYHADDLIKCPRCRVTVTHGGGVQDLDREISLRRRNAEERDRSGRWTLVDFVIDVPRPADLAVPVDRDERLRHLGYLD